MNETTRDSKTRSETERTREAKGAGKMKQKILLALDGSEASLNAARYVGEIAAQGNGFEITLFHVLMIGKDIGPYPKLELHRSGSEAMVPLVDKRVRWLQDNWERVRTDVFNPAKEILERLGAKPAIQRSRLKVIAEATNDLARTIINEIREGAYGTVVLGLHESPESGVGSERLAPVIVRQAKDCSVWVVEPCRKAS